MPVLSIIWNIVITKDDDHIHNTPLISIITYFIIYKIQFNVRDLLICYIDSLELAHDWNYHRKSNLALAHLIAYLVDLKYDFTFLLALDNILSPLTNKSFHILYDTKRCSLQNDGAEEEEPAHEEHLDTFACLA